MKEIESLKKYLGETYMPFKKKELTKLLDLVRVDQKKKDAEIARIMFKGRAEYGMPGALIGSRIAKAIEGQAR